MVAPATMTMTKTTTAAVVVVVVISWRGDAFRRWRCRWWRYWPSVVVLLFG